VIRVVIFSGLSCGYCEKCLSGRDNECNQFRPLGVLEDGVSAEYVKVPAVNVLKFRMICLLKKLHAYQLHTLRCGIL
jgi:Zn-dependent alcohol dehydrogenases